MCNCSGQIGNCNCNDCSLITVPSIQGPQGPQGPAGPQGLPGESGFMVVEAENTFTPNPPVWGLVAYQNGYMVDITEMYNTNMDKLHIQASFFVTAGDITPCIMGVAVNSTVNIIGQVPLVQFGDGVNDNIGAGSRIFTVEFDLVRINNNNHYVFGHSLITSSTIEIVDNIYDSKYFQGTVAGNVNSIKFGNNFYIYLFATDSNVDPYTLTITPAYFSVEFKKHKP